jgi:hypothetical protein
MESVKLVVTIRDFEKAPKNLTSVASNILGTRAKSK